MTHLAERDLMYGPTVHCCATAPFPSFFQASIVAIDSLKITYFILLIEAKLAKYFYLLNNFTTVLFVRYQQGPPGVYLNGNLENAINPREVSELFSTFDSVVC